AIEARTRASVAEIADVPAVLLVEVDAQGRGLGRILFSQPVEGRAVGLAVTDVVILVDGLAVPDEGELLALQSDVVGLPLARRPREVLARESPLVEGATIMPAELGLAVAVEDLDLE